MKPKLYPGMFAQHPKHGRDWLRDIPEDERRIFGKLGLMQACEKTKYQFWSDGGKARAKTAKRDTRPGHEGRFLPKEHLP